MLELQRNVIFGQFVETGSFIHRMDARIKIAATSAFIVASFLIDDFLGFAVMLPLVVVIGVVSRIPLGYVLRGSRIFIAFLAFILAFQVLFYSRDVPESSYLWRWGLLSVSTEGLYTAGILALRVILLYYVTTMLMLTTSLVDLTNGLRAHFRPAATAENSCQRAGARLRDRHKVRPDLYRGDGTSRPRPDGPRRPFRRGRRTDPCAPPRTPAHPYLHKRLRPCRYPNHRHEHPQLPRRPLPHQAPPDARETSPTGSPSHWSSPG